MGQNPPTGSQAISVWGQRALGLICLAAGAILTYLLWTVWPIPVDDAAVATPSATWCISDARPAAATPQAPTIAPADAHKPDVPTKSGWNPCVRLFGSWGWALAADIRLLYIVALAAALGSFVQVATSFSTFVGNGKFSASWIWWYVLRAPVGIALAYVFYFAIRGGILTPSGSTENINVFGIAAISGLVGLFSKQASDKLEETFKTLFRVAAGSGDDQRSGKLANPSITSLIPATVAAGSGATSLTINGQGFFSATCAEIAGTLRATVFHNEKLLVATLAPADIAASGMLRVRVTNPDGSASDFASITITSAE